MHGEAILPQYFFRNENAAMVDLKVPTINIANEAPRIKSVTLLYHNSKGKRLFKWLNIKNKCISCLVVGSDSFWLSETNAELIYVLVPSVNVYFLEGKATLNLFALQRG